MSQPRSDIPPELKLCDDPWSLGPTERMQLLDQRRESQMAWLRLLTNLIEPPPLGQDFPAFLLDTPPFAELRQAIGSARSARDLDTGTADQLQRFVDCYRHYLHVDATP